MTPTRRERIEGGISGLLVGDALGVPYEFHAPETLPPHEQIEYEPPFGFNRAHDQIAPGTWSDDGAQALCLLVSLLDCERFDAEDFAHRLQMWYDDGYMAVGGVVFDIGVTTGVALRALRSGVPALEAGPKDPYSNGNGSLMRVLPLALWHRGDDAEMVRDAHAQSRVTHGHLRAQACCALYCLWAQRVLADTPDAWNEAVAALRAVYRNDEAAIAELEWSIRPDDDTPGRGSGYVVDCLRSARDAARKPTFEEAVRYAIKLGYDTDTTACVAGGIAGLRDGVAAIPARWTKNLRERETVAPLLERLLAR